MTQLSISTGAGVLDTITAGPPEGRPALLLHGFPQTGLVWRRQIEALAAHGYRVVAPDGHDWGGAVAWWTAHARPGRVRAIGVVDVPTLYVWSTEDSAFGPAVAQETERWVKGRTGSRPSRASATGSPRRRPKRSAACCSNTCKPTARSESTANVPLADTPKR
ncbi:alpha/beta fold hydrolase [Streptomyces africanus]|uniref:alpha/beta fold hydrolase n=1 Tax=Streptomyces africanus TaxID=231024 RepID=UPI00244875D3|nr:hypothetical protein [Streptomyces africanus]